MEARADLLKENDKKSDSLSSLLEKNGLAQYAGNILEQINTVAELEVVMQELQLTDICDYFHVNLSVGIKLRNLHDVVAVQPLLRKSDTMSARAMSVVPSIINGNSGVIAVPTSSK